MKTSSEVFTGANKQMVQKKDSRSPIFSNNQISCMEKKVSKINWWKWINVIWLFDLYSSKSPYINFAEVIPTVW